MEEQETVAVVEETTEQPQDTTGLSDEELEAMFSQEQEKESTNQDPAAESADETPGEHEETPPKQETEPKTPEEGAPQEEDTAAPEKVPVDLEKLTKQIADKEAMIQHQANEVGDLRGQVTKLQAHLAQMELKDGPQLTAEEKAKLEEKYYDDSVGLTIAANKLLKEKEAVHIEKVQKYREEQTRKNKDFVLSEIPDFGELIDDMTQIAKKDGVPEQLINSFKSNPFNEEPSFLINFARRTKVEKENTALREQVSALQKQLEDLPKKLSEKAKSSPGLTGKISSAPKSPLNVSENQMHNLSDADIDKALEAALREEGG